MDDVRFKGHDVSRDTQKHYMFRTHDWRKGTSHNHADTCLVHQFVLLLRWIVDAEHMFSIFSLREHDCSYCTFMVVVVADGGRGI